MSGPLYALGQQRGCVKCGAEESKGRPPLCARCLDRINRALALEGQNRIPEHVRASILSRIDHAY